jgi:4-hydroxy-4-methyl-2-oxoglutarate aldolase
VKASVPSVGQPLTITGVRVAPGDLVVADDDGVVAIPAEAAERTLAAGESRAAKEAQMMERIVGGTSTLELLGLTRWREQA